MIYIKLFWEFLKIGLFSVGGGMATLPFLYDLSDNTGWFSAEQIADMLAVSESTPGPIGINMATYAGYIVGGVSGSIVASIGVIIPGIIIVSVITRVLVKFRRNLYVDGAFYGLRPASVGLITAAGLIVAKITFFNSDFTIGVTDNVIFDIIKIIDYKSVILAIVLLALTNSIRFTKKLHPIIFILLSAAIGAAFSFAK